MLPNMKSDAGYDPLKDFVPVTQLVGIPLGLIAHPTLPAANVNGLIALARQKPGGINYAIFRQENLSREGQPRVFTVEAVRYQFQEMQLPQRSDQPNVANAGETQTR